MQIQQLSHHNKMLALYISANHGYPESLCTYTKMRAHFHVRLRQAGWLAKKLVALHKVTKASKQQRALFKTASHLMFQHTIIMTSFILFYELFWTLTKYLQSSPQHCHTIKYDYSSYFKSFNEWREEFKICSTQRLKCRDSTNLRCAGICNATVIFWFGLRVIFTLCSNLIDNRHCIQQTLSQS